MFPTQSVVYHAHYAYALHNNAIAVPSGNWPFAARHVHFSSLIVHDTSARFPRVDQLGVSPEANITNRETSNTRKHPFLPQFMEIAWCSQAKLSTEVDVCLPMSLNLLQAVVKIRTCKVRYRAHSKDGRMPSNRLE